MNKENKDLRFLIFSAQDVIFIYNKLITAGVRVILDGGWAVDAILEKETRIHSDLDIIISIKQIKLLQKVLFREGFKVYPEETDLPNRIVMMNENKSLLVDTHLLSFKKDGSGIQNLIKYKYIYTAKGLAGSGKILNSPVNCLSVDEQIRCRENKKYSFDDPDRLRYNGINADYHDLALLKKYNQQNSN